MAKRQSTAERFWSYVLKTETCWLWKGAVRNAEIGYGGYRFQNRMQSTHRISWILARGPIPDGMSVLHLCDVGACVNPEHLFLGTQLDNMRDRNKKGRSNTARGSHHGHAKLTEEQVREIRAIGGSKAFVATLYGVSPALVSMIRSRKIWKHVL